ncbi:MAG: zinc ribbon domain-containing protein [Candidatus Aminicenantales bacterium]
MMFFFIGGIQPRAVSLRKEPGLCPICGRHSLYFKRVDHYLSLFFIPLFPVKRGIPFQACKNCNAVFDEGGFQVEMEKKRDRARCPSCGRTVVADFNFCPYCGRPVR